MLFIFAEEDWGGQNSVPPRFANDADDAAENC